MIRSASGRNKNELLLAVGDGVHGRHVERADIAIPVLVQQVNVRLRRQQLIVDHRLEELNAGHEPRRQPSTNLTLRI